VFLAIGGEKGEESSKLLFVLMALTWHRMCFTARNEVLLECTVVWTYVVGRGCMNGYGKRNCYCKAGNAYVAEDRLKACRQKKRCDFHQSV